MPWPVGVQPLHRGADFRDDFGQRRLRRKRVADGRDVKAARQRPLCHAGENFLAIALPVTAVNEHKQRCIGLSALEDIDPVARFRTVRKIE